MKTKDSINALIKKRRAKVYTASEIKEMIRCGRIPSADEVDVVTCGTFGVMSGTMAVISVPVAGPGSFERADTIRLNGVPGIPGPCPNENLGIVDCVVYGTSGRDGRYGGGHLFRDIVNGNPIVAEVTSRGKEFRKELTIADMHARMITTRGAFRNYTAFFNRDSGSRDTIFSVTGMKGSMKEASVSGCGEINPIQNDHAHYLREGAPILINGGRGIILGPGTRSSASRPNISAAADMKNMKADLMGGFITSAGPECMTSFTAAMPITDRASLDGVFVLDDSIELPVADIHTRVPAASASYGDVWTGTSRNITVNAEMCMNCSSCRPMEVCPTEALRPARINIGMCVVCGSCVSSCAGGVFSADLGHINCNGTKIPITLRQSDRNRAERSAEDLKRMIEEGKWCL